jgi:hypothetical protein
MRMSHEISILVPLGVLGVNLGQRPSEISQEITQGESVIREIELRQILKLLISMGYVKEQVVRESTVSCRETSTIKRGFIFEVDGERYAMDGEIGDVGLN